MRILATAVALIALGGAPYQAVPHQIPHLDGLVLDGALRDWAGIAAITIDPTLTGPERRRRRGEFSVGATDLEVTVRLAVDDEAFWFAVTWADDEIDVARLGSEQATWEDANGDHRDRMYFYDDLIVRLAHAEWMYGLWLAPRADPVQWDVLFLGALGPDRVSTEPAAASAIGSRVDGRWVMEVRVPRAAFADRLVDGEELELRLIAADSDCPALDLGTKADTCIEYLSWIGPIAVGPASAALTR